MKIKAGENAIRQKSCLKHAVCLSGQDWNRRFEGKHARTGTLLLREENFNWNNLPIRRKFNLEATKVPLACPFTLMKAVLFLSPEAGKYKCRFLFPLPSSVFDLRWNFRQKEKYWRFIHCST